MIQILQLRDLPPNDKAALFKQALRNARISLLNAQMIVGPMDERYQIIDEMIETLEEEITKKQTPSS